VIKIELHKRACPLIKLTFTLDHKIIFNYRFYSRWEIVSNS